MIAIEAVKQAAWEAGALTLEMRRQGLHKIQDKSSTIDLVTEADLAAEQSLRRALAQIDPEIEFWGEESNERPGGSRFWVVDPIDGTTNFANGLAPYAINIALYEADQVQLGVTLELPARRLYWAARDQGAHVQEFDSHGPVGEAARLQVNRVDTLNQALLTTGFPYHRAEHSDNNLTEFAWFFARAQGVRCMGSAAMDLAHVAAGIFAAYWEAWLKPWDVAPGVLMVQEAGGTVTDYRGAPWQLGSVGIVASNGQPALHAALIEGIQAARANLPSKLLDV
ncbi:MAG: inositol monophosphatase family protein [Litorilinea sp.]